MRSVEEWFASLEPLPLAQAVPDPQAAAVFSADMIVGFCHNGALASERVGALETPVVDLFRRAHAHGVRRFVLLQDTHAEAAPEFDAFPAHCVRGTEESETIPALRALPFSDSFTIFPKNSLAPGFGTGFDAWLDLSAGLRTAIVVGDCTDLCVYQLAMHLRMRANALNVSGFTVIVPADCVDTYDAPDHDGSFFHRVFLYHLALNGARVVASLP